MQAASRQGRRGRLSAGPAAGYLLLAAGAFFGIWLACRAWEPQSDDNPLVVLVLIWVIAGVAHIFIRAFWRACFIAAAGSALGYVVVAFMLTSNLSQNEMFGAGIIEVGLFGFVLAMVMGIPVVIYRRSR